MVAHWLAELDGRKVTVEVPASSANLGAGYDCLGVALALTNTDRARGPRLEPRRDRADRRGRGPRRAHRRTATTGSSRASRPPSRPPAASCPTGVGWRIVMHNQIPLVARPRLVGGGDGRRASWRATRSSATRSATADLLALATEIEGHPDNAAAALLGGFTVSAAWSTTASRPSASTRRATCGRCCSSRSCASRPSAMRKALPAKVPLVDAVANLGAVGARRRRAGDRPLRPAAAA